MTIDDAIDIEKNFSTTELKEYHSRLAEWLEELKYLRAKTSELYDEIQSESAFIKEHDKQIRADAIEEFKQEFYERAHFEAWSMKFEIYQLDLLTLFEQLKENKNE